MRYHSDGLHLLKDITLSDDQILLVHNVNILLSASHTIPFPRVLDSSHSPFRIFSFEFASTWNSANHPRSWCCIVLTNLAIMYSSLTSSLSFRYFSRYFVWDLTNKFTSAMIAFFTHQCSVIARHTCSLTAIQANKCVEAFSKFLAGGCGTNSPTRFLAVVIRTKI